MRKSSLIPILVIAAVGGYLLYKKMGAGSAGSTLAPMALTSANVPVTQLSPISTAGMTPISAANFGTLTPPTAPGSNAGFWAGVQNFLNPGSAG